MKVTKSQITGVYYVHLDGGNIVYGYSKEDAIELAKEMYPFLVTDLQEISDYPEEFEKNKGFFSDDLPEESE